MATSRRVSLLCKRILTGMLAGAFSLLNAAEIKIDFGSVKGRMKPEHGVGQPPKTGTSGKMYHYLKEAGIPYSRLHDVGGWHGQNMFVDIPNIFRDFDADENDPASYDFSFTDVLLKDLVANGVETKDGRVTAVVAVLPDGMWDQAQIPGSRERRRLVGAFYITPSDIMLERTYHDTVYRAYSNFDTHGQTRSPQFFIEDPPHEPLYVNVPYRALLPKTLDGLLVAGLGMSAHRDAMPVIRMVADMQNQGYVAGVASAMAVASGVPVRAICVKTLQRRLAEKGVIPFETVGTADSFPPTDADFDRAVRTLPNGYEGIGDPAGVQALARLLLLPGVGGHALRADAEVPPVRNYSNKEGDRERTRVLKELCLARAVFNLGDTPDGLGRRTLEAYAADPRRAYAEHARLVLTRT